MVIMTRLEVLLFIFAIVCKAQVSYHNIDAVFLWVNGSDPDWQESYERTIGESIDMKRFRDNDELKYSIRSIE